MTKKATREIVSLIKVKTLLSNIFLHWLSRFFVVFMLLMMLLFCTFAVAQAQPDSFSFTFSSYGTAHKQLTQGVSFDGSGSIIVTE